jgi:hypothetical protein
MTLSAQQCFFPRFDIVQNPMTNSLWSVYSFSKMATDTSDLVPLKEPPRYMKDWRFQPVSYPVEWCEKYRPGGLLPVHLGGRLCDGRFKVIRKLGYGASSTVWLAVDEQVNPFET